MTYRIVERPVRFGAHRHQWTVTVSACMALVACWGCATWAARGFPGRLASMEKISNAKLDADFKPTDGMEVSIQDRTYLTHIGSGDRKVAFAGDSLLFHYGPRAQQLADEGHLTASVYFISAGSCAPVPGIIRYDDFAHCANLPGMLTDLVRREKVQSIVLGAAWTGYRGEGMFIKRNGGLLPLKSNEGKDAFFANLEDFIRSLEGYGAKVYLVLGSPISGRFDPKSMVTRSAFGLQVVRDADKGVPTAELRSPYASTDAQLREIAQRTGATPLDVVPDICSEGDSCLPLFDGGEPKFSDGMHLRPIFVRRHLHFLDFLMR
jgi:hypothetical protein